MSAYADQTLTLDEYKAAKNKLVEEKRAFGGANGSSREKSPVMVRTGHPVRKSQ